MPKFGRSEAMITHKKTPVGLGKGAHLPGTVSHQKNIHGYLPVNAVNLPKADGFVRRAIHYDTIMIRNEWSSL